MILILPTFFLQDHSFGYYTLNAPTRSRPSWQEASKLEPFDPPTENEPSRGFRNIPSVPYSDPYYNNPSNWLKRFKPVTPQKSAQPFNEYTGFIDYFHVGSEPASLVDPSNAYAGAELNVDSSDAQYSQNTVQVPDNKPIDHILNPAFDDDYVVIVVNAEKVHDINLSKLLALLKNKFFPGQVVGRDSPVVAADNNKGTDRFDSDNYYPPKLPTVEHETRSKFNNHFESDDYMPKYIRFGPDNHLQDQPGSLYRPQEDRSSEKATFDPANQADSTKVPDDKESDNLAHPQSADTGFEPEPLNLTFGPIPVVPDSDPNKASSAVSGLVPETFLGEAGLDKDKDNLAQSLSAGTGFEPITIPHIEPNNFIYGPIPVVPDSDPNKVSSVIAGVVPETFLKDFGLDAEKYRDIYGDPASRPYYVAVTLDIDKVCNVIGYMLFINRV